MKLKLLISLLLSLVFVVQPVAAVAMETDQYNLPPVPLADIGDEVSEYVEVNLRAAIARVNAEIAQRQSCVNMAGAIGTTCSDTETERGKLAFLRSNDAVAKELYKLLGDGNIFVSKLGKWMNSHEFRGSPSRYKSDYLHSIYIASPINYATLSPTVRLYGVEFGIDKLDHFFQQGYKYYKIQKEAVWKGSTPKQAETKAIKWGQKTERTYFGLLVSGVYSNADLYANYVGMRFYQGLTVPTLIGEKTRTSPVSLEDGVWRVARTSLRENLLKPFLTEHLNEALNPSGYAFSIFGSVSRAVKKYGCPAWKQPYPDLTATVLAVRSKALEIWNGEDYGYTKRNRTVSLAETCFQKGTNEQ
jgi:hypothetical protein